jgi:CheY-like chemotaxis protein
MFRYEGPSLAERMREPGADPAALIAGMAALNRRIHRRRGSRVPDLGSRLRHRIAQAPALDLADRRALLDELARLAATGDRLCHGDFHPGNVLGPPGRPVVVDCVDAVAGDPRADACRSYLLLRGFSRDSRRPTSMPTPPRPRSGPRSSGGSPWWRPRGSPRGVFPELIFLDLNMPEMDGLNFLKYFKKMILQNKVKVVLLTGSIGPKQMKVLLELGFTNVIEKPLTEAKLQYMLEKESV